MHGVPAAHHWLLWDVDPLEVDAVRDADFVIPRILEHGGLSAVQWLLRECGLDRIHQFLRDVGHPELSPRTLHFWRAVLHAEDEPWASPPSWRTSSSAPWID